MEKTDFHDALQRGAKGKAILFCGAGASLDALNFGLKELPSVNPLLEKFNHFLNTKYTRLPIAASRVADSSLHEYYKIITDSFTVRSVSDDMKKIMAFPWSRVYTTNYDNSLELSCGGIEKKCQTITAKDSPRDLIKGRLPIIHLHGFVNHFRIDTIRGECILDYSSNVANSVYNGLWATELKNDISTSDVIVFLGYSLYDPEIAKIILQGGFSKKKIFFINSRIENEELEYMQSQFGIPINIEKDGFARVIDSIPKNIEPSEKNYVCFLSARNFVADHRIVTYQDVTDLFIFGKVIDGLIQNDIVNETSTYVIKLKSIDRVKKEISSGKTLISLYSPLGHGKTILTKILATELGKERDVFLAVRNQQEFMEEILYIIKNFNNPIIIIDDYYKYARYQMALSNLSSNDVTFIFTSRLNVFETRKEELNSLFLNHDVIDIRIGLLEEEDAEQLVPLINQAGMWGDLSNISDEEKSKKLLSKDKNGFQRNFADILVGLMDSNDMIGRIKKELNILKTISVDAYNIVLLSIYLEFTNNHVNEFVIDQGLGVRLSDVSEDDNIINIFRIFFSSNGMSGGYFSGSLFAKYAIEKICNSDDLLGVIEYAANRFSGIRDISQEAKLLLIDLLRFNYLKVIAGNTRSRFHRIKELYSHLSANPNLNKDDLFWNAFGMCERQMGNFNDAINHFRTGISYAKNRGGKYIPYHAQNQLIICLLEQGIEIDIDQDTAYKNTIEIVDLLMVQADDERDYGRGQAFKWHQELNIFLEKYYQLFSEAEKNRITIKYIRYVKFIKENVMEWRRRKEASIMVVTLEDFLKSNPLGN